MKKLLGILLMVCSLAANAQSRAELEEQRNRTLEDIKYVDNLLKQTSKQRNESLGMLNILSRKITLREDVVQGMRDEIDLLNYRIDLNRLAIRLMEEDLSFMLKEYEKAILHAQMVSKGQPDIIYIFSSKDLNQGYKRLKYLQQVAKYRRKEAEVIVELKSRIEENKNELEDDLGRIVDLKGEEEQQVASLQKEQKSKKNMVTALGRKERQLKQDLQKKRAIAAQIEKEIARVIEAERKRLETRKMTPEETLNGEDFEKNKGKLPWPVERGVLTGQFGVHDHPVFKGTKVDNIGIEITSIEKVKARTVFKGKVVSVFGIPGGNMAVIIRHGEYLTVYQNVVNVVVKPGDELATKQVIGDVFSDPEEGGKSIVKFMIYKEKTKLNPELWLAKSK